MAQPDSQAASADLEILKENVFKDLDCAKLSTAKAVIKKWENVLREHNFCQQFIRKKTNARDQWKVLAQRHQWQEDVDDTLHHQGVYLNIISDIRCLLYNWTCWIPSRRFIDCKEDWKEPLCLQFDEDKIVCGFRDDKIRIWNRKNIDAGPNVLEGHRERVTSIQLDGDVLFSGSEDETVRVWKISTGEEKQQVRHEGFCPLRRVRYRDGVLATCGRQRMFRVFTVRDFSLEIKHTVKESDFVTDVDIDSERIVASFGDMTIKVYDTETANLEQTLEMSGFNVMRLLYGSIYCSANKVVAGVCSCGSIRIWAIQSDRIFCVRETYQTGATCLQFGPLELFSAHSNGSVKAYFSNRKYSCMDEYFGMLLRDVKEHNDVIYDMQVDHINLVTCSMDGRIAILDFLENPMPQHLS